MSAKGLISQLLGDEMPGRRARPGISFTRSKSMDRHIPERDVGFLLGLLRRSRNAWVEHPSVTARVVATEGADEGLDRAHIGAAVDGSCRGQERLGVGVELGNVDHGSEVLLKRLHPRLIKISPGVLRAGLGNTR